MLRNVSGDCCPLLHHGVHVDRGHDRIDHQVSTVREKVLGDDVSKPRAGSCS
jgi:hypothetical protein